MKLLETLDVHAEDLHREHEQALSATKAEVEKMTELPRFVRLLAEGPPPGPSGEES